VTRYWLRSLDGVEVRALPGTETIAAGASPAAWSWDSRYLIFSTFTMNKLKKIDIQGGPPQTLADFPGVMYGAAWNRDGIIVAGTTTGPLLRLSASSGAATPATALDKNESRHAFPQFLPDGRHFLYQRVSPDPNKMGVYIGSIDAKPEEQSLKRLLASPRPAYYAPSPNGGPGHLLFMREATLMAQPFDPARMEFSGESSVIAEGVHSREVATYGLFSVSDTGTLVYRGGAASRMALTWFDQQGSPGSTVGEPGDYANPAVSPDGTRVAVAIGPETNRDIWILDVVRGNSTRFTFDPASDDNPVWSPDGKSIVFSSTRSGLGDLYIKPADGSGEERLLFKSDESKTPTSWAKDGRFLLFTSIGPKTALDIWALPMQGEAKPVVIVQTPFFEALGQFSPDGRWIAYLSGESGTPEIYVRPFSPEAGAGATGGKWMVSKATGAHPRWRADGKALFYSTLNLQHMVVDIDTSKGFQAGAPRRLFVAPPPLLTIGWDLAPDGNRFLFVAPPAGARAAPFTVVLNWAAALKK
jgi:dipeptidyl aminopeptidase/acylaminoacyl peptidase